jgi:hypothetical protein
MRLNLLIFALLPHAIFAAGAELRSLDSFPTRFERNMGQAGAEVEYLVRARGYTLLLGERGLQFHAPGQSAAPAINFVGASLHPSVDAIDPVATRVNDYTGPRNSWVTGAPCWSSIRYRNLYPDVDLIFYGQGSQLEYDVRVEPGGDPARMAFALDPSLKANIDASGDLQLAVSSGTLTWHKPVAYQLIADRRQPVDASFALSGNRLSFRISSFDRRYPLIIDPSLGFATYYGGSALDGARGIAVDSSGNVLIAGGTTSGNLPGLNASSSQVDYMGNMDAFVAKMNGSGTALAWVTYLGGAGQDLGTGIAVDSPGNVYVTGYTDSSDFPIYPSATSVVQGTYGGGGGNGSFYMFGDAFVAKFDPTGKLVWSTYLGGTKDDVGTAVTVDSSGNVYIAGATVSSNFPGVSSGFQSTFGGLGGQPTVAESGYVSFDTGDAFVAKIDPTGAHLSATYLGGSLDDFALALTLDSGGNIWVGGGTISTNFPLAGAFQSTFGGGTNFNAQPIFSAGDGFISELSSDLKTLKYSTYFGGNQDDAVSGIAVDSSGAIYVTGATQSSNFPGASNSYGGPSVSSTLSSPYIIGDAFVAKLEPGGSKLAFSSYLGGSGEDGATALGVDAQGNVTVVGGTDSANFCTTTAGAVSSQLNGGASEPSAAYPLPNVGDGFIARFNSSGSLTYCSYIGGAAYDILNGLALDASGNVYATGLSTSSNFPSNRRRHVQAATAGPRDAVALKLTVYSGPAIQTVVGAGLSIPLDRYHFSERAADDLRSGVHRGRRLARNHRAPSLVNNALCRRSLRIRACRAGTSRIGGCFSSPPRRSTPWQGTLPSSGTVPISVITNCGSANPDHHAGFQRGRWPPRRPSFLYFQANGNGQDPVAACGPPSPALDVGRAGAHRRRQLLRRRMAATCWYSLRSGLGTDQFDRADWNTLATGTPGVTGAYSLTVGGTGCQSFLLCRA